MTSNTWTKISPTILLVIISLACITQIVLLLSQLFPKLKLLLNSLLKIRALDDSEVIPHSLPDYIMPFINITYNDVFYVISDFRSGKPYGPDSATPNVLKHCGSMPALCLVTLLYRFNLFLRKVTLRIIQTTDQLLKLPVFFSIWIYNSWQGT